MAHHPTRKWKYYYNLRPRLLFALQAPKLSDEGRRVVEELNQKGICITSCDRLLGAGAFERLKEAVQRVQTAKSEEIQTARKSASDDGAPGAKKYAMFLLSKPTLDPTNFFVQFMLQDAIIDVANSYMEMFTKFWYFNIWQTFVTQSPAKESQLWHYDADDRMVLKCFIYVTDVDDGAGPFTYAPATHAKVPMLGTVETIPGNTGRSSDEQMNKLVPEKNWIKGVGPAGTIIFADTAGYHKGGLCRRSERVMFDCMFVSQAARRPESFVRAPFERPRDFKRAFALSPSDPKFTQNYLKKMKEMEAAKMGS